MIKRKMVWGVGLLILIGIGTAAVTVVNARQITHEVEVSSNIFTPEVLTIAVGDTVNWTNVQGFHDVTQTSGPEFFSSGDAGFNWEYSHTFTLPGTYEYTCTIHFGMDGTVIVEEAAQPTDTPAPTATATLPAPTLTPTSSAPTPDPTDIPSTATPTPNPNISERGFLPLIWEVVSQE
ncbi:MAG: plastocyanin/azurin family copper-binding protein [Chloroflexota bacterium]